MNAIRILLILILPLHVVAQSPNWEVDTTVIRLGEPITVTFSATIHADSLAVFPNYDAWTDRSFVIIESDSLVSKPKNKLKTINQTLVVTSFDTGFAVLEPVMWRYNNDEFESDPVMVEVRWVMIDEGSSLFDIKDVLSVPYPWYVYALIALIVVLLIILIRYIIKRIKQPRLEPIQEPEVDPYDWATERLNVLRSSDIWTNEKYGLFFLELTTIIRQFVERSHGVRVMEATLDELLQRVDLLPLTPEQRKSMKAFFQHAELIKYAKQSPNQSDADYYIQEVETFINWLNSAQNNDIDE
jgi:hypothetical protein